MDLRFTIEPHDILSVHLTDGEMKTTVSVGSPRAGVDTLRRAFQTAVEEGYGECFWPGATGGQYWWVFKRTVETMEVAAMWTRGGASSWEHVFRATDSVEWVREQLNAELG